MLPHERYQKLTEHLKKHGIIKIEHMTRLFDISIETARRDLTYLEKKGIVKKIYGGATLLENGTKEPDTSERLSKNLEEKAAIGRKCAEFINDGDSILIEVGTTTLQVAKALKAKKNLTVITNSIHVVNELMDTDFGLYIIGGRIRHGEGSISGAISIIFPRADRFRPWMNFWKFAIISELRPVSSLMNRRKIRPSFRRPHRN